MVCIAAFIVLIVVGIFVAFLSIFKRDLGKKYLKVLKKSWHCFTRHLTFRKCDTSFQDDVKTALLKKSKNVLDANFIEGMACIGGCIGGAGCLTHGEKNKAQVDEYGKEALEKTITDAVSVLK